MIPTAQKSCYMPAVRRIVVAFVLVLGIAFAAGCVADSEAPKHGEHEILSDRPSGFWTSNRPAEGGAYKYRLMLVGLGVLALTGIFTFRLIRGARKPS